MSEQFSFGMAIAHLKDGKRVARAGWNGKGMWLILIQAGLTAEEESYADVPGQTYEVYLDDRMAGIQKLLPWIGMKTADNGFVPWLASQTDMLAEDWTLVA
jgi:hypothetical protein